MVLQSVHPIFCWELRWDSFYFNTNELPNLNNMQINLSCLIIKVKDRYSNIEILFR